MSILSDRLAACAKRQPRRLETLEMDVVVTKIVVEDAKRMEELKKQHGTDPVAVLTFILSNFFRTPEGEPLFDPKDSKIVGELPMDVVGEINKIFAEVNGQDYEELKKKVQI